MRHRRGSPRSLPRRALAPPEGFAPEPHAPPEGPCPACALPEGLTPDLHALPEPLTHTRSWRGRALPCASPEGLGPYKLTPSETQRGARFETEREREEWLGTAASEGWLRELRAHS